MTELLGHLHPVLVHLPIGILLLACFFQLLSAREKYLHLEHAIGITLCWGMVSLRLGDRPNAPERGRPDGSPSCHAQPVRECAPLRPERPVVEGQSAWASNRAGPILTEPALAGQPGRAGDAVSAARRPGARRPRRDAGWFRTAAGGRVSW